MNNVKKLLAVLVVVTMLITAMIPVMAADTFSYDAQAKVLWDLKLFLGESATEYVPGLGNDLTREQGVIMLVRLLGAEDDALALTAAQVDAALTFADAADISTWAKAYVAYAKINGYFVGVGDNKAAPGAKLSGKDYCTMVLRALGYTVDAAGWANAANILVEKGGLTAAEAAKFNDKDLIRDDAVGITYGALLGKTSANNTLIAALVAAGAVDLAKAQAAGLIPVIPDVKDVTMSNLREVVVTFTAPVNATEAAKVANYTVGNSTIGTKAPKTAAVAADGKSVVLTLDSAAYSDVIANYASYTVVVKAAVGISADVTKTVKAIDVVVPNLVSAVSVGPKSVKLTFSEPLAKVTNEVAVASAFKLDNGTMALKPVTADANGVVIADGAKTIILETYIDLAEGKHTIAFDGTLVKDAAGYAVQPASIDFNYVKDLSALTYTVGATTETTVKITFSKILTDTAFSNVQVSHSYNSAAYAATKVESTDKLTYTFTWAKDKPLPPGTTTVYVSYKDASGTKITDQYGVTMDAFSFPVTTTPDFVKPTATVAFTNANSLAVTYSESVQDVATYGNTNAADYMYNYTLKDSAGTAITITGAAFATGSTTVVNLTTANLNGGSYTLEIKNVKDLSLAGNTIDTVVLPFTCTDKVAPGYAATPFVKLSDKVVKVCFNEVMDVATITNKLAYKLNGAALASGDTIVASADGKAAIITFATAPALNSTLTVTSPLMKDLAGNWIDSTADAIKTYTFVALVPVSYSQVAITGKNTIKVTIADIVTGMGVGDWQIVANDSDEEYAVSGISATYDATNTYITLYTSDFTYANDVAFATYETGLTVSTIGKNITNAYGNYVQFTVSPVVDKYAPAISTVSRILGADGKITAMQVVFSENMYLASIQDSDFTVSGTTVSSVTCTDISNGVGKTFVIDVTDIAAKDVANTDINPTVTIAGSVEDAARNALTGVSKASTLTIVP